MRDSTETSILIKGLSFATKKFAGVINAWTEAEAALDRSSFDTLYRSVNQEVLYEEYSQPAYKELTGRRGFPKEEITTLSNEMTKTGKTKWFIYNSYQESKSFKRYENPNTSWIYKRED